MAAQSSTLILHEDSVTQKLTLGSLEKETSKTVTGFYEALSEAALFDTGILPLDGTGVLAIRKAANHTQIVFQHTPGLYYVIWGVSEGSSSAKEYHLAQPYRIVIGDLADGQLLGARHFYSPVPITSADQQLYHCNLPNLNCQGYGGTSVGWICLYHTEDYSNLSFGQKVFAVTERASGHEAYNDNNMSGTDGPRFYEAQYKTNLGSKAGDYAYLWNPHIWQKKSKEEGFEWTLNSDIWIPVKVANVDKQDKHYPNGVGLTLDMAMRGGYHAYYTDPHQPKLVNAFSRDDLEIDQSQISQLFTHAFTKAVDSKKAPSANGTLPDAQEASQTPSQESLTSSPQQNQWQNLLSQHNPDGISAVIGDVNLSTASSTGNITLTCKHCNTASTKVNDFTFQNDGVVCHSCFETKYDICLTCKIAKHYGHLFKMPTESGEIFTFCKSCHNEIVCSKCGKVYLDNHSAIHEDGCATCEPFVPCNMCDVEIPPGQITSIWAKDLTAVNSTSDLFSNQETLLLVLCPTCIGTHKICGCGYLQPSEQVGDTLEDVPACSPCLSFNPDGAPIYCPVQSTSPSTSSIDGITYLHKGN